MSNNFQLRLTHLFKGGEAPPAPLWLPASSHVRFLYEVHFGNMQFRFKIYITSYMVILER